MIQGVFTNDFETYESFENFKAKQKGAPKKKPTLKQSGAPSTTVTKKTPLKTLVKQAKTPLKKLATIATKGTGVAKKTAQIALLIPYYPVMRIMVKKRGMKPETNPEKLTTQFYEGVVKGKNYDSYSQQRFDSYMSMGQSEDGESFDMTTVVAACLKFLKQAVVLLKKKGDKEETGAVNESEGLMGAAMKFLKGGDPSPANTGDENGNGASAASGAPSASGSSNTGLIVGGIAAAGIIAFFALRK